VRDAVEQDHPPVLRRPLPRTRSRHVHDLVAVESALLRDRESALSGLDGEHAPRRTRRIFESAECEEEDRAESDPAEGDAHVRIITGRFMMSGVTREEIEQQLVAIVRKEKEIPEGLLQTDTELAAAGIDSLDALTILFAIEEHFRISIPDATARAMKTFGDMVQAVADQVKAES
jgi:acyl carrier protein